MTPLHLFRHQNYTADHWHTNSGSHAFASSKAFVNSDVADATTSRETHDLDGMYCLSGIMEAALKGQVVTLLAYEHPAITSTDIW